MNAGSLFRYFSSDLAIDLGTANTLVFERNKGIVVNEPSIVALRKHSGDVEAVGNEARDMLGRTPEQITAIKPMKNGVIADFTATAQMLNHFIRKAHNRKRLVHPRIVIGVPSEITPVERRAVLEACSKASEVYLVQQPMMAAVGAGLPVAEPLGNLVVDIGGGTTDVAVISLAGIVYAHSVRVAGNAMDDVIIEHCKRKHNLLIGERTAEEVKIGIGSAVPLKEPLTMEVRGRDLVSGLPKNIRLDSREVTEAIQDPLAQIVGAVRGVLEQTPPELAADIYDKGIVLTGGGALLRNLDRYLVMHTGVPAIVADDPQTCVARGTGLALEHFEVLKRNQLYLR
jgi:rod shape-determining protein MreB and related proteins